MIMIYRFPFYYHTSNVLIVGQERSFFFRWERAPKWCLKIYWHVNKSFTHVRDRSLFIVWGKAEDFRGDHLIFRRKKGGISRKREPPRGNRLKFWKDSEGGPLKFAWRMETWEEGSRKSSKLLGGITSVK